MPARDSQLGGECRSNVAKDGPTWRDAGATVPARDSQLGGECRSNVAKDGPTGRDSGATVDARDSQLGGDGGRIMPEGTRGCGASFDASYGDFLRLVSDDSDDVSDSGGFSDGDGDEDSEDAIYRRSKGLLAQPRLDQHDPAFWRHGGVTEASDMDIELQDLEDPDVSSTDLARGCDS